MLSKGFKVHGDKIVNKNGYEVPRGWDVRKATFSFVRSYPGELVGIPDVPHGVFRCKQTGEEVIKPRIVSTKDYGHKNALLR